MWWDAQNRNFALEEERLDLACFKIGGVQSKTEAKREGQSSAEQPMQKVLGSIPSLFSDRKGCERTSF